MIFRLDIRQGVKRPEMMPEAMKDKGEKKKLAEYFVVIGRLDLRPGEILIGMNDKPNVFWTLLLAIQVKQNLTNPILFPR